MCQGDTWLSLHNAQRNSVPRCIGKLFEEHELTKDRQNNRGSYTKVVMAHLLFGFMISDALCDSLKHLY